MRTAKTAFLAVAMTTLAFGHAATAATDAEIKERVRASFGIEDNGPMAWRTLLSAIDLCEGDTNRFVSVLCSLAGESLAAGDEEVARGVVWDIGYFGTTNSLPFLYGCATNAVVGGEAMIAAVKIGGISSNSVEHLGLFLALPSVRTVDKVDCCEQISKLPIATSAANADKLLMADFLRQYALSANVWTEFLDESIVRFDPTYLHSKRRLAVMRSVVNLDLNDYDTNFVTNTINELVAYPESALGD